LTVVIGKHEAEAVFKKNNDLVEFRRMKQFTGNAVISQGLGPTIQKTCFNAKARTKSSKKMILNTRRYLRIAIWTREMRQLTERVVTTLKAWGFSG